MISDKILTDLSSISQSAILELFEVDLTVINQTAGVFRFHAGMNELLKSLVWQGKSYDPFPIKADGFDKSGQGTSNRPTLTVANITGLITGLSEDYDDLLGAVVIRRQVPIKFLDAVNFENGNRQADPTQEIVSKYIVERLTGLTAEYATFELALPCESDGALIPARVIVANTCCWQYRSSECSYTGKAIADEFDNPTIDPLKDKCSRSLKGCKMRFGNNNPLPFGGFPSSSKLS